MREIIDMDKGWKLYDGDISATSKGCAFASDTVRLHFTKTGNHAISRCGYDDSGWTEVDLPHDFVSGRGEFLPHEEVFRGNLRSGIVWYRKTFKLSEQDEGRRMWVEFDGVFRDSEVWMNGLYLGRNMSGYTSFSFDIGDAAIFGGDNTIAVRVDASELEGWWYEGGGIYRSVRLVKTAALHIPKWGVFIKSFLNSSYTAADIEVDIEYGNEASEPAAFKIAVQLVEPGNTAVAEIMSEVIHAGAYSSGISSLKLSMENPLLWSCDSPALYTAQVTLLAEDSPVDACETAFGIRECRFDTEKGFFLNGMPTKIKGMCVHESHACVGTAIPYAVNEYRMALLKEIGCNAYRAAHNPPSPQLLDICDRMGIMVMDEVRSMNTAAEHMDQLESMMRRDRNHPCVILWSLGNEEVAVQGTQTGARILKRLIRKAKSLDTTRPLTYAMSGYWVELTGQHEKYGARLDVKGFNYCLEKQWKKYDEFHSKYPHDPVLISEIGAAVSTRDNYLYDPDMDKIALPESARQSFSWGSEERIGLVMGYGDCYPNFGCTAEESLKAVSGREFIQGLFYWSGFDYRGETYPYSWPSVVARCGVYDLCGFPKDIAWYFKAWWTDKPVLHILPHWNWAEMEGKEIEVWAYTNMDEVEFILNGKACGKFRVPVPGHVQCRIEYRCGRLEAIGYKEDKAVVHTSVETTGPAGRILLKPVKTALKADGRDVCIINAAIVDGKGASVPTADNRIHFSIKGPGRILGTGSGNPTSHERDTGTSCRAYNGLCQVMIQSEEAEGTVRLIAESAGLAGNETDIAVQG